MRLKVEHVTTFQYDMPVYETATEIRLRPTEEIYCPQRLLDFEIKIDPDAPLFNYDDYFGNCVYNFNLLTHHKTLRITSIAVVETGEGRCMPTEHDELMCMDLVSESRFVQLDESIRNFAAEVGFDGDNLETATRICKRIQETFKYEPGITNVQSPSSEVMAIKQGVCQDFAHVMIAACRVRQIPARYVSGYLYGGALSERDDRASHAWCEVWCGSATGWVGLDPTHDTTYVDERYIRIGVGRDYNDIPPVRGTYKGNATESLRVVVRVSEV